MKKITKCVIFGGNDLACRGGVDPHWEVWGRLMDLYWGAGVFCISGIELEMQKGKVEWQWIGLAFVMVRMNGRLFRQKY